MSRIVDVPIRSKGCDALGLCAFDYASELAFGVALGQFSEAELADIADVFSSDYVRGGALAELARRERLS